MKNGLGTMLFTCIRVVLYIWKFHVIIFVFYKNSFHASIILAMLNISLDWEMCHVMCLLVFPKETVPRCKYFRRVISQNNQLPTNDFLLYM